MQAELSECKTIIWNGPMGVFEMEKVKEPYIHSKEPYIHIHNAKPSSGTAPWASLRWKR